MRSVEVMLEIAKFVLVPFAIVVLPALSDPRVEAPVTESVPWMRWLPVVVAPPFTVSPVV